MENIVMTFAEASKRWSLGESTLRSTIKTDRLEEGIDYWKSGGTWLITEDAMIRIYGYPENMKEINTKLLAEYFKDIKSSKSDNNDFLFKQIRYEINSCDDNIFNEEDLIGICVIRVLKKCSWLNIENYNDFNNVNSFIKLLFKEIKKKYRLKTDDKEFFNLAAAIIQMSEQENRL